MQPETLKREESLNKWLLASAITRHGTATRITRLPCNSCTPHLMRLESTLYPFHFPGRTKRVEDAALCLTIATDTEYWTGQAILLTKKDVADLIGVLAGELSRMADAPDIEEDK